jgi:hypothetical protein
MARERAHSEALIVLLLEMFVFLGFCLGVQVLVRAADEQPVLVTTTVAGLVLCSAAMALAAGVNEFSDDGRGVQGVVFVLVRAAWHFSLASTMNVKTFVALVYTADDAQHRNWSLLLLQTQTHAMENRLFTAAQNAWVLAVVSVVVLMHAVFYSKISRSTEERNCDVGRFTTMYAFHALLVQYSTEFALGRLCAVGPLDNPERPDEIESCELPLVADNLEADYGALGPLALLLAVLCASDVLACVLHAKLMRVADLRSDMQKVRAVTVEVLHAACALVPCAAYLAFASIALEYTTPAHFAYLVVVGLALAFSCCRRVWTAVSTRAQHLVGQSEEAPPHLTAEVILSAVPVELAPALPAAHMRPAIQKGTSQVKKRQ